MFRSLFFLVATNFAIVIVLAVAAHMLGLNAHLQNSTNLNLTSLLAYCFLFGMGGAWLNLLLSKFLTKLMLKAKVITGSEGSLEAKVFNMVAKYAQKAALPMPEVAIYDGAPNALATGYSKNNSLVAVSTGLVRTLSDRELEAVIAHEIAHIKNGDMVTMTLIQGVLNTFVFFLARVVGWVVDRVILKNEEDSPGIGYLATVIVMDIVLGILAMMISLWFSRQREFRADSGASHLLGSTEPMKSALIRLTQVGNESSLPKSATALGIYGGAKSGWFSSHPTIEERISYLNSLSISKA